ncbi:hypothetical protein PHSY_000684 [Pseudozyma hubeiensis SY62]|uniref:Vacuolar-sorting protein SNF7 n=1 Tax=Pseudozyma hubeiensis (strain SY62) TaxID=1305764 RepID=R9NX66_PSEHS|nr:hypothetical protein PHSY_000684 [Pseudozyma hubeiensis SY62]GAC93122.1 hypothetical protein PHSY_000684 [Pseudozyma hubeiensis SY62]
MTAPDPPPTTKEGLSAYISTHPSFQDTRSSSSPLPALYSDLSRQRKSNPAGYRASVEWWKDVLLDVTFRGVQFETSDTVQDRTIFTLDESTKARWTIPSVGRPLGLGTVVSDLATEHVAYRVSSFLHSSAPIALPASIIRDRSGGRGLKSYIPTPSGVASTLLLTPAKFLASSLYTLTIGGANDDESYSADEQLFHKNRGEWVLLPLVDRIATTFLARFEEEASISPLACLMTKGEFAVRLGEICEKEFGFGVVGDKDVDVLLKYLSRDLNRAVRQDSLVKIFLQGQSPTRLTAEDMSVITVKETLRKLDLQLISLSQRITSLDSSIKTSLRQNQKQLALTHLRNRKTLQQTLDQRSNVRDKLAAVVAKIEQAKTDVEVMKAFSASEEVLRSVLGRDELRIENVERVMDGVEELVGRQGEVEDAMKMTSGDVDEDEILEELKGLEREKRQEEDTKRLQEQERIPEQNKVNQTDPNPESKETQDKQLEDDLQARLDRLRLSTPLPTSPPPQPKSNTTTHPAHSAIAES